MRDDREDHTARKAPLNLREIIQANQSWREGRTDYDRHLVDVLLCLFGYAGLRSGEVSWLRWQDVAAAQGNIYVWDRTGRIVSPHPDIWPVLDAWRQLQEQLLQAPVSVQQFVALNQQKRPIFRNYIAKRLRALSRHLGESVYPQVLRRHFATLMVSEGRLSLEELRDAMGHQDVETTRRYVEDGSQGHG